MPIPLPIHEHDCPGCRFLGSFDGKDVYQCDGIDLIIRKSSEEQDNRALPISLAKRIALENRDAELMAAYALYITIPVGEQRLYRDLEPLMVRRRMDDEDVYREETD
jgi:hypothetical protein